MYKIIDLSTGNTYKLNELLTNYINIPNDLNKDFIFYNKLEALEFIELFIFSYRWEVIEV